MTACAVAALTVYDMVKGLERGVAIEQVVLLEKSGGRSDWRRARTASGADPAMRAAIVTVSTSKSRGEGEDESGERAGRRFAERLGARGRRPRARSPTTARAIEERLRHWATTSAASWS